MAKQTLEDVLIKRIDNDIRGIRIGTKDPSELKTLDDLDRLRLINEGMYEELIAKLANVLRDYSKRKKIIA
jgi:hypothetical protein